MSCIKFRFSEVNKKGGDNMDSTRDIARENFEYQRGYNHGFLDGYNKGLELYIKQQITAPPERIIVVTEKQMEELKKNKPLGEVLGGE